jgi:cell division protein FtsZ
MTLNLQLPQKQTLKPTIAVFGVGGGGGNAVSNMIAANLEGVNFVVANTDAQALEENLCKEHIQLGNDITQGLGAGSFPEVGKASAEDSNADILEHLQGSNMVFITAGLGGGTGTGAAPVVARLAKEQGILTVAVVTKPFHFEGSHRMRVAEQGLKELQEYVDTLIVIPNQNLFRVADKNTTFLDAFKLADEVLHSGVRGITDLMTMPGLINLDFSDVRSVMSEMGKAMMGTGDAEGDSRAIDAAEAAIANPLLDNVSMKGARGVLINITGGADMTLFEVDEAANRIREEVDGDANIIFGSAFNKDLEGKIRVSVVATGIDGAPEDRKVTHIYAEQPARPEPTVSTMNESVSFGNEASTGLYSSIAEDVAAESAPKAISAEPIAESAPKSDRALAMENQAMLDLNDGYVPPAPAEVSRESEQEPLKLPDGLFEPVEKPASSGLFGGFFGGSRKKDEAPAVEAAAVAPAPAKPDSGLSAQFSAAVEQAGGSSISTADEDDLDIPAFLRRKK